MTVTSPAPPTSRLRSNGSAAVRVKAAHDRRLPWVALALLLVIGGGLLATLLVQSAGERTAVLVASRPIAAGQVITQNDLTVVEVGVDGEASIIPATSRASVIGQVAVVGIPKGALLAAGQIASDAGLREGEVVVGALLGPGELPVPSLRPGDVVRLVAVTGGQAAERETLGRAEVFAVSPGTQSGFVFVSLVVDEAMADAVADVAAQQRLRLLLLPASERSGG